jgi:hypothetical protein
MRVREGMARSLPRHSRLVRGRYFRRAGVEHDAINAGTEPLAFVDVELEDRPG